MADISAIKLPSGSKYDIKDIEGRNISAINYNKIISLGEQLVVNGSAMLGYNTNFTDWKYDGSESNGSGGSFTITNDTARQPTTNYFFPINPNIEYRLDFDIKSKLSVGRMYSFFAFYDADKISITASNHMYMSNTLTTLSQDLNNGDTVVHLDDLTEWRNASSTPNMQLGFIFWNYTNSYGYTYPENTYSRNVWSSLYTYDKIDKTNNTITLKSGWTHGSFPAGTKVSQPNSGSTFKYIATSGTIVPTTWTHYTGLMRGTDYSGQNVMGKFPPAVAYAKVSFLWNYQGTGNGEQFWLTNLSVQTLPDISKVTGILPITNGGTGQTTAANAINALLNGLPTWTTDPTDTTYFIRQDIGGAAVYGKVQATTLWNYISGKLPAWSKASTKPSYNFSEIGSTPTTLSGYGITDAKIANGTITLGSNTITPLTSSSTLDASKLSGAIPSAVTATTQASTDNSTKIATTAYVTTAIANLPEPMIFKGSVGTGGTITSLPTAAAANEGWTYKVITALSSPSAKVGDTVISNGSEWVVIPSGDEPSGTVTSVGVSNATNGGLTVSGSPVTSSGTITIGHSNVLSSAQTTQAVYPIKIDKNGHISAYGSAVTIPTVPSNIVNTITTTAGVHTTISSQKGDVSFNIPTKTSHLTNDSGYITGIDAAMVKAALGTGTGTTKFLREDGSWSTPAYTTISTTSSGSGNVVTGLSNNGGAITYTLGKNALIVSLSGDGTSWHWRKYGDGKFEAWYIYDGTVTLQTQTSVSKLYRNKDAYSITIPSGVGVSDIYYTHIECNSGLAGMYATVTDISGSKISYYICCPAASSTAINNRATTITAHIVGTWS